MIINSSLLLYSPHYPHQYHSYHQHINLLLSLIFISVSIITFPCHSVSDGCMQKASKSPLSCRSKLPPLTEDQWLMFLGLTEFKTPLLCGRSGWQQQHVAPQWLHSISSCNGFVGVSGTAVDLQRDVNSWNENRWLIGYGCIVDSGAVNRWSVADVSDSERVPWAEVHHHTPLIDGNCNPVLTVTVFCCQRRGV